MPILSSIPTPSFRTYAGFSISVYAIYIALSCYYEDFGNVSEFLAHQYENFWTDILLLNIMACGIVMLGRGLIYLLFGPLRAIEEQNMRDKMNHYILYKFVFLFGVLNLGEFNLVTRWFVWCGGLASMYLLEKLCRDRADYLSFSPSTRFKNHLPGFGLVLTLHLISIVLLVAVLYTRGTDIHITLFLIADSVLMYLRTLDGIIRYSILFYDMYKNSRWENKDVLLYYSELIMEVTLLYTDLVHNLHMLVWSGVLLSMGSFILCMHIKSLYGELCKRWQRHKNFRSIMDSMDSKFLVATPEDLRANDDHCAICWDTMETARKLPCGHLFHISCLRSWLEHDTSCPTCRLSLGPTQPETPAAAAPRPRNRSWQFRGSRWASWLPNFSVHVISAPQITSIDVMVDRVIEVLPHVSRQEIESDLRRTMNPDQTIENMLQGTIEEEDDDEDDDDMYTDDEEELEEEGSTQLTPSTSHQNLSIQGHEDRYQQYDSINGYSSYHDSQWGTHNNEAHNETREEGSWNEVVTGESQEMRRRRLLDAIHRRWNAT